MVYLGVATLTGYHPVDGKLSENLYCEKSENQTKFLSEKTIYFGD